MPGIDWTDCLKRPVKRGSSVKILPGIFFSAHMNGRPLFTAEGSSSDDSGQQLVNWITWAFDLQWPRKPLRQRSWLGRWQERQR